MTDPSTPLRLHGYFRSTAAWRVRIALNLKQVPAETISHHLRRGEQRAEAYLRLNPQGLVPALELDAGKSVLTQSLAICEWLEETLRSTEGSRRSFASLTTERASAVCASASSVAG